MYDISINDDGFIVSEHTKIFSYGHKVDFNKMKASDCLRLMDKLKRVYFDKLKENN